MQKTAPPIELLAPAGSPQALAAAIAEGADAAYLGLQDFNARMRSANFTYAQFEAALRSARRLGKKIYVTVNTVFQEREADRMYQLLKFLSLTGPDAVIVQDYGVLAMIRSDFPSLKIHASTQMNVSSSRGANLLSKFGVSRVVLARELCLEELIGIRAGTNAELEVFVHGALCVSASGICLFSSYWGGKSANRGLCTHACRRLYNAPHGEEAGGYFFSPADLQLLEGLPDLAACGINCVKIEGRMKSSGYVGTVVSAYRLVLDAVGGGEGVEESVARAKGILQGDFAREKTRFYFDSGRPDPSGWLSPFKDGSTGIPLGAILKTKGRGEDALALVLPQGGAAPAAGDSVRLHSADDSKRASYRLAASEPDGEGGFWISLAGGFETGDRAYIIQKKESAKRYRPLVSKGAKGRQPGMAKAPAPLADFKNAKQQKDQFPAGLYVAVSSPEDLYIVQSARPQKVMLHLSQKTLIRLLADKNPLPFRPHEIILSLPAYFPQGEADFYADGAGRLVEKGYSQFELNNLGHFSLLRGLDHVSILAGPWLYVFNSWALSFVASLGARAFVCPLENNKQNLEKTVAAAGGAGKRAGEKLRSKVFVTVFSRPELFNIRADLSRIYDFNTFSDSAGETFILDAGREGSRVYPEKPFSIIDKMPHLKEAGFERFIIDLKGAPLKKSDWRDLTRSAGENSPLQNVSRFNWKNGFFSRNEA